MFVEQVGGMMEHFRITILTHAGKNFCRIPGLRRYFRIRTRDSAGNLSRTIIPQPFPARPPPLIYACWAK
jgi:hypothetical protein